MFEQIKIRSRIRDTPYTVDFISNFAETLKNVVRNDDVIVVDRQIPQLYPSLTFDKIGHTWSIEATEHAKSYDGVAPLFQHLIESGFRKNNRLIAVGGGVTQDMTGFVASLLYRGIDWVFFPTNILTQCDSCIGSKTSINFGSYKNQLGNFYPPAEIYIDTLFSRTLGSREIASGLGEMLHYFLVTSEEDLDLFWRYAPALKRGDGQLEPLMHRSLEIKKAMIEIDEFDTGPRNVFNYGHSFGHALESATDYNIPHGIAVSYGMDLANLVSARLGLLTMSERNRMRAACYLVYDQFPVERVDFEEYFSALMRDKKNVGSQLGLVLTRGVGDMFKQLCHPTDEIKATIAEFFTNQLYLRDL